MNLSKELAGIPSNANMLIQRKISRNSRALMKSNVKLTDAELTITEGLRKAIDRLMRDPGIPTEKKISMAHDLIMNSPEITSSNRNMIVNKLFESKEFRDFFFQANKIDNTGDMVTRYVEIERKGDWSGFFAEVLPESTVNVIFLTFSVFTMGAVMYYGGFAKNVAGVGIMAYKGIASGDAYKGIANVYNTGSNIVSWISRLIRDYKNLNDVIEVGKKGMEAIYQEDNKSSIEEKKILT